jgi:tetratricopeptide (TPR) repeat protein
MPLHRMTHVTLALSLAAVTAIGTACNKSGNEVKSVAASEGGGKLPITTKSEEARHEFLQGRDLSERLLGQESIQHFDKAIASDPDFASAELALANNSPTAKEFFEHLKKAVVLADKASEGEKFLILANEAGANGDIPKQRDYLEKLVAAYPNDERAQFNLANFYFGQQEIDQAIEHYKKATTLAPNYSPAYNVLGYAYRQHADYSDAEQAFKTYINLIPNDPNPYDSYAELLLKMGRFDDSQAQYRRALSVDPHFMASHFGLSAALLYAGMGQEAQAELQKMADQARNDGERRTAYFGMAVLATDAGKFDQALQAMDKQYAVAQKINDVVAMAGDIQGKGRILVEIPRFEDAQREFDRSFQIIENSTQSQGVKDTAKLLHQFNLTELAIEKKNFGAAKAKAEEFRQGAEATKNPAQIRQAHELAGRIALGEKEYAKAITELEQADLQNPQNLYRLSHAYQGSGDHAKAEDYLARAANFNSLPRLAYAFVRVKLQTTTVKKG